MKAYSIPFFKAFWFRKSMKKRVSKLDNKIDKIGNKIDGLIAETNCKIEFKKSTICKMNEEIKLLENELQEINDLKNKLEK